MINSYPKVWQFGHKAISSLLMGQITISEKIDGSQFSMGIFDGQLECRSKNMQINLDDPGMFAKAVHTAKSLDLFPGWIYRCEFLGKPKHNTLTYSRVPKNNLIVYDIVTGIETYASVESLILESERIGLECVPIYFNGFVIGGIETINRGGYLERESILGGTKIEGVVIKNYSVFTEEKKVAMGKYVREDFQELNKKEWKKSNPTSGDVIDNIIQSLKTDARWRKSVQHLREMGKLEQSPRDISNLLTEIKEDIKAECTDEIVKALLVYAMPKIMRGVTNGVPEWYKKELEKGILDESLD